MKKKISEAAQYALSAVFFYAALNYVRNVFLKPVIYDVFFSVLRRAVIVIGPQYSLRALRMSVCVITSSSGLVSIKPVITDDPDKNCMLVTFAVPANISGHFKYSIVRRGKKLFSGTGFLETETGNAEKKSRLKYRLSITTLFKYETEYLREWIDYHRGAGVEHFYLYENNATADKKIADIIAPYIREGLVTHILWPYPYAFYNYKLRKLWPNDALMYTQIPQINHAIYKSAGVTEWLLSCDVDEYFYSPRYAKLTDAIDAVVAQAGREKNHKKISSIQTEGFWFGGTVAEAAAARHNGVLRTFTRSERQPTSAYKCIFDTASVRLASVHNSLVQDGEELRVSPDILRFNHYRALGWKKRLDEHVARDVENTEILKKL